jgi:PAS domain S-box-containing protein
MSGMPVEERVGRPLEELVGPMADRVLPLYRHALASGEPLLEQEVSGESPTEPRSVHHWLVSCTPVRASDGTILGVSSVVQDVTERRELLERERAARRRATFLARASELLESSLDYETTLRNIAQIVVPEIVDWCVIHVLDDAGELKLVAVAHADPEKEALAWELDARYPTEPDAPTGAPAVIRSGQPELVSVISDEMLVAAAKDEIHLGLLRELGLVSYMCVPLQARGRTLGAFTLISSEPGRVYGDDDLMLAQELARRAASAIDNARLFREAEERAQAARVLASIGDGVLLVDRGGRIRLWNRAAETITGLAATHVVGRRAAEAVPGWPEIAPRVPVATAGGPATAASVPVDLGGRELWLSISGVGYEDGTVYAFRDLTTERALEELRQDLVATVSHELRTPLAAIYGAALTLRRADIEIEATLRDKLLEVISDESERLSVIVNDLLLASRLDSGAIDVQIERCDARDLVEAVVEAARTHLPATVTLELEAPAELPPVAADAEQLRQVLANLVDNAVKYSPDGGPVTVKVEPADGYMRFAVSDAGIGIAAPEQRRIFEKFYRADPQMSRGIGGTGLGLYISRELVRRVDGRIWVESAVGRGSTFFVEIPLASSRSQAKRAGAAA